MKYDWQNVDNCRNQVLEKWDFITLLSEIFYHEPLKRNIHEATESQPNSDWKNSHTLFILWKMNVLTMKFFKYFCPALICSFLFHIQPASSH